MEHKNKLSVLVLSCDKYADLWPPFFECFFRFWPDCDLPVYLGVNEKSFANERVRIILSGEDRDWSSSARKIIEQIDSEYLLILLEDLFLIENVSSGKFKSSFDALVRNNFKHCHIDQRTKPELGGEDGLGVYPKGMPYRVNVLGLWKKDYLLKMLIDGENPWNFEIMGSYRSAYDEGFYCLPAGIFETINMVEKGQWFPDKLKIAQKMELTLDTSKRKILSGTALWKSRLQVSIVSLILLLPWRKRVKLMNMLRRLLFSY